MPQLRQRPRATLVVVIGARETTVSLLHCSCPGSLIAWVALAGSRWPRSCSYLSARPQQPLCQDKICSNLLCLQNPVSGQMSGIRTRGVVKADTKVSNLRMRTDRCAHCGHV